VKISVGIFRALAAKARAGRLTVNLRVELIPRLGLHHHLLVDHRRLGPLSVHVVPVGCLVVLGGESGSLDPSLGAMELGYKGKDGDEKDEDEEE